MSKVLLYQYDSPEIKIIIEAYFNEDDLVVEGYDIGKRVEECWGDSDYEYSVTVHQSEVLKIYPLLGVADGDREGLLKAIAARFNTNFAYSEFRNFLEKNGIAGEGFSWT
jgi:hypothetical protein